MLPADDLGLPTRLAPIARELADRGHEVAMFNPAPAPAKLIADAGLKNLPMPATDMRPSWGDLVQANQAWDVEHMFGAIFADEAFVRAATVMHIDLMREYRPDVVIDSFGPFGCLAARILKVPLASVLQGNFHPASEGFLWWAGERPAGLPSAAPIFNAVAAEYGAATAERVVDLLAGDLSLVVGTPETDPVSTAARVTHVGRILWQRANSVLPDWVTALGRDRPAIWVYAGNPRYAGVGSNAFDSIVVIRAAIAALGDAPVQVVLTAGYLALPEEIGALPPNFHLATYLPGPAMAERCDLMIHHGGHSSVMTGLSAGTPAVMIPTSTERESNARRVAALGAGEFAMPVAGADGEKQIDIAEFSAKVQRVLKEPGYRAAAGRVAESMRRYGGAREAADRIESFAHGKV
jgi:UDP:flavonoid glycosyltransferase YjiC (YdhE family)